MSAELNENLGYECHDCGETFEPGQSTEPCTSQGHYVGPVAACGLLTFTSPCER